MTHAQLMAASIPELETELARYALPTMPGAVKVQKHLNYRAALDTYGDMVKTKALNGPGSNPIGNPPPPPGP